jgi:hypothetical protein
VLFASFFLSCGTAPLNIDLCSHDQPVGKAYCVNTISQEDSTIEIDETDKWIMISPDDWGDILIRLRILESRTKGTTQKEFTNILNANKALIQ